MNESVESPNTRNWPNRTILGTGSTIVTVHGGLGFDHSYFRPFLDSLASSHRLVYFDLLGNGKCDATVDWPNITHQSYVDDLERLRIELGVESFNLFGHSYGGFLALEYALAHPRRVSSLILCSTAANFQHIPQAIDNIRRKSSDEEFNSVMQAIGSPSTSDAALSRDIQCVLPYYFHAPTPELINRTMGRVIYKAEPFNRAAFGLAGNFDLADRLDSVRVPTLIVGGDDDWIMPYDVGCTTLAQGIPGATLVKIADCGHFPFAEKESEFVGVVSDWLRERASIA